MTPLTISIFDFHWVVSALTTTTASPSLMKTNLKETNKKKIAKQEHQDQEYPHLFPSTALSDSRSQSTLVLMTTKPLVLIISHRRINQAIHRQETEISQKPREIKPSLNIKKMVKSAYELSGS